MSESHHPLVELAIRLIIHEETQTFELSDEGRAELVAALESYETDRNFPEIVMKLVELSYFAHAEMNCPNVAASLLRVAETAVPQLEARGEAGKRAVQAIANQDEISRRFQKYSNAPGAVLSKDKPAPAGSVTSGPFARFALADKAKDGKS